MFSNEIRSIRAALAAFTTPLNEEDQQLVRQARANLEALAVQIEEWEGPKPDLGASIDSIKIKGSPVEVAAVAASLGINLDNSGVLK